MHPSLEILYYRMLGARIGKNVIINSDAQLGEFDLLNLQDECQIDESHVRGFRVERNGYFRLDDISIGRAAVLNTYTVISPGALVPDGTVCGPHASSHDKPSPPSYAAYNRAMIPEPNWLMSVCVAWPIILAVRTISCLSSISFSHLFGTDIHLGLGLDFPWFAAIVLMMHQSHLVTHNSSALRSMIFHFASPRRVVFLLLSIVARAVLTPVIQLVLGIAIKRLLGFNVVCSTANATQLTSLRRYINSILLSQRALHNAFVILGNRSEIVSVRVASWM